MPVGRCMKQIVIYVLFWSMAMKQLHFDNLKYLLCEHDLHLKKTHNFFMKNKILSIHYSWLAN